MRSGDRGAAGAGTRAGGAQASLPVDGLPGLDPRWSRLVTVPVTAQAPVDPPGRLEPRTFHLLDSWVGRTDGAEPLGTLLCVHGNPTWSYLWRRLVDGAPAGWRVIAADHLGMGFSDRGDRPRNLAQRVDDLSRLTDALGVTGPVVTVGHDWGGIISLGWAVRHPGQVRGVVLTNTAVHQDERSRGPVLIRFAAQPWVNELTCRLTPVFVRGVTSVNVPRPAPAVRVAFAAPYRGTARRAAVAEFVADVPFADRHPSKSAVDRIAEQVRALDVPALIMWGPRDPVFGRLHLADLRTRLPQAVLHRFEGAGHLLPEDAPGYVRVIDRWIAELPAEPERGGPGNSERGELPPPQQLSDSVPAPSVLAELLDRADDDSPVVVEVGGRQISWAQLHHRVGAVAAGLRQAGIGPGHRVALLVPPSIELTVALYAVWWAGGSVVLADRGLGIGAIGRALRGAAVDHVIADTAGLLAAGPLHIPGSRIAVRDTGPLNRLSSRFASVSHTLPGLERAGAGLQPAAIRTGPTDRPDDEAAVLFTSGATGPAKGVRYRHRQLRAQLRLIRELYCLTDQDRMVAAFAPFALYGPALGVCTAVPSTDVTRPATLTAVALAQAARVIGATVVFAAPAALRNVLATGPAASVADREALAGVRLLMSAGAPVPAPLLRRLRDLLPNAAMHTPYGMTEALPVTDISLPEIEAAGDGDGVCVGRPPTGVSIRLAPLDQLGTPGDELTDRTGVSGEICVSAAHVRDSYDALWLTDRAGWAAPGWHRTGDVGVFDDSGRLWVQGRTTHVIATAAGPVTPVGIEQRVGRALPELGPTEVAAVGVGPRGTQQVVIVLAGTGGPLAAQALTDAVRAAAGVPLAAVLVRGGLPVDIRHQSKIDRIALGRWASRVLAGG